LDSANYSSKFLDFLRECLMFDPADRLKPFDLLSHQIFKKFEKIYVSQQVVVSRPFTSVEKYHLKKVRCINRLKNQ